MREKYKLSSIISFVIFCSSISLAQVHKGINFQGVIKSPTGEAITRSGLTVQGLIFSPNNCILRVEEFSNVSIHNGYINLVLGKGSPVAGQDPGLPFDKVMDNSQVIPNLTCYDSSGNTTTSSYDPAVGDGRRKFRLTVTLDSIPVVADFNMRSVAYAVSAENADEAKKLNGKLASDFVQITGGVTQQKVQDWFSSSVMSSILDSSYKPSAAVSADTLSVTLPIGKGGTGGTTADQARTNLGLGPLAIKPLGDANKVLYGDGRWDSLPVGNSGTISSLMGDVMASGSGAVAATVNSVGGSSAANVHSAEILANAATSNNTASALVKRDASGNFSAGTITGSLTGAASLNVLKSGDTLSGSLTFGANLGNVFTAGTGSNTVSLQGPSSSVGTSYVLRLPTSQGASNQVLTNDGSGNLSWTTPSTTATAYSGVLPIANGGTNSSATLNNNRIMASSGGAIVEAAAIPANKALISDANGIPTASSVTNTELGFLSGVTSAIQTQLDGKANSTGWTNFSAIASNNSGALTAVPGSTTGTVLQYSAMGPLWSSAAFPISTTANQLLYSSSNNVVGGLSTASNSVLTTNSSGVPSWSVISNDLFSQYAFLSGRSGGQMLIGGTEASDTLTLDSTSNATKGFVVLNPSGGNVGIGTSNPGSTLTVNGVVESKTGGIKFPDGSVQVSAAGSGLTWNTVTVNTNAISNNGYVVNSASTTILTLPASCRVGDIVSVSGIGTGYWNLAVPSGMVFKGRSGNTTSSSIVPPASSDSLQVMCVVADSTWLLVSGSHAGITDICLHGSQTFNYQAGNQYFTVPAGCYQITVSAIGGGGGGGGSSTGGYAYTYNGGGCGGGGGGYSTQTISTTPGTTYTVVVGVGGASGIGNSATGTSGGAGGMSSFNSTIVANGGSGGQAGGNPTSGACGVGGTGTTTNGQNAPGPNSGSSNWTGTSGGNSGMGSGAGAYGWMTGGNGTSPGGGGGGGSPYGGGASNGGSGAAGIVTVTY